MAFDVRLFVHGDFCLFPTISISLYIYFFLFTCEFQLVVLTCYPSCHTFPKCVLISDKPAGGGYVITPVNKGRESLVKHMLAVNWKFWKVYLRQPSGRSITIRMLERLAGTFYSTD
jgi:hypothetical protein